MSLGYLLLAMETVPARPPSSDAITCGGELEGRGRRCTRGNDAAQVVVKSQTSHGIDRRWQRELRAFF